MSIESNPYRGKWLHEVLGHIEDEAKLTKPAGMSMAEACEILIAEREERHIINSEEAAFLRKVRESR